MVARWFTRFAPMSLCALVGVLAFTAAPALAAAPEEPSGVTVLAPVGATTASVEGFLSPKAEGHPGSYEFLYNKASSGECKNGAHAPESPGMMLGFEDERVGETLRGLEPSTEYMVCLLARNPKGEESVGPATAFTTAKPPQTRRALDSFGGASSSVVDPYPLSNPQGIAVNDTSKDVYVSDTGNHRVSEFEADGTFIRAFGEEVGGFGANVCGGLVACKEGVSASTPGAFEHPQFLAIDQTTGDVYVADTGDKTVSKFSPEGVLEASWGREGQLDVKALAESRSLTTGEGTLTEGETEVGDLTAKTGAFTQGQELSGEGIPVGETIRRVFPGGLLLNQGATKSGRVALTAVKRFGSMAGIAVDPTTGTLYVMNAAGQVLEFDPDSTFVSEVQIPGHGPGNEEFAKGGVAVDQAGNIFYTRSGNIEEASPSGAEVGTVVTYPHTVQAFTLGQEGDLYFAGEERGLSRVEFNGASEIVEPGGGSCAIRPEGECGPTESAAVGYVGSGVGVASNGEPLLSDEAAGEVAEYGPLVTVIPPETPETLPASEVKATSATLHGVLNPSSVGEPESGTYEFLYRPSLTQCEGGKATPAVPAAAERGEAVSTVAGELLPGTVYTFCLRTTNGAGETATGAPVSFTTHVASPGAEGLSISDVAATSATLNASVDAGGGVTSCAFEYAPSGGAFAPAPGADGGVVVAEGDQSVPVSFHAQGLQAGTVYEFRVSVTNSAGLSVSESLSFTTQAAGGGLVLPDERQWELVSPPDKHGALLQPIFDEGGLAQAAVDGDAMTFLASAPTESRPQGYSVVEQVLSARGSDGWVSRDISPPHEHVAGLGYGQAQEYVAFSEDLSLAVLQPHGPFESALSPEASEQTPYLRTLFLDGDVNDPCVEGCYRPLVTGKPGYANVEPGATFGGGEACLQQAICGPIFSGATPDLSHIWFSSSAPLVAGSGNYERYEWSEGKLSVNNNPLKLRVSTSEDGSWSYFVSANALAPGAVPEACQNRGFDASGLCNLYVSHGGVTKLVAVLSDKDEADWSGSSGSDNGLNNRTSRVSPNGRWFAFMSQQELTGYATHDAISRKPDEEVYLYHAPENLSSEAGTLVCASCNPTGARPVGREAEELENYEHELVVPHHSDWESSQWIAANVPGWTNYTSGSALYQSRYLSDSGRLFFDSNDALVSQDVNGNEDVYEYEPPGVGDCTTASALFSLRSDGCVGLISSGQATGESAFLDASESGGDVFFLTSAKLVPQDYDSALDVYDAHECINAAPCFPTPAAVPPPCYTGDACKAGPTPQPAIYGSPSSETFSGAGNVTPEKPATIVAKAKAKGSTKVQELRRALRACHAKKGARRRTCERRARARLARVSTVVARKKGRG
jgi:DNA-binding beta-propeller fold protein YncE